MLLFSAVSHASSLKILYASDMPNIGNEDAGGYARLATAVKQLRQSQQPTLFLFGGNSLGPSPMSMFDSGSHIIDILNSIEPDAMAVSKREYSYYEDQLSLRSYEALFPLLASNIEDPRTNAIQSGLAENVLIEQNDIKVGIISVVTPAAAQEYLLQRVIIKNVEQSIRDNAKILREQGAKLVLLMHAADYPKLQTLLEEKVIDISFYKSRYSPLSFASNRAVELTKASQYGIVDVNFPSDAAPEISWRIYDLKELPADPLVQQQISQYQYRLDRIMDLPLTLVDRPFDTLRNEVRSKENEFANFITDTIREYANADVAILNGGLIRGNHKYKQGDVFTHKSLVKELPFGSRLMVIKILGKDILDALEISLSQFQGFKGKFPQVSNIQLKFDSSQPPFNRVVSVLIDGRPLDLNRVYTLATSDYLYNGGDDFTPFSRGERTDQQQKNPLISDIVLREIISQKRLISPISNRLIDVHE